MTPVNRAVPNSEKPMIPGMDCELGVTGEEKAMHDPRSRKTREEIGTRMENSVD